MISKNDLEDPKVIEEMFKKAEADYNSEEGRKYRAKQRAAAKKLKESAK